MIFANLSSRLASTPQSDGSSCRGRALISNKCTSKKEDKLYSIHVPSRYFKYMYLSTHSEKDEILLVVFSDAVVDPGTVVVHFADASPANTEAHKHTFERLNNEHDIL